MVNVAYSQPLCSTACDKSANIYSVCCEHISLVLSQPLKNRSLLFSPLLWRTYLSCSLFSSAEHISLVLPLSSEPSLCHFSSWRLSSTSDRTCASKRANVRGVITGTYPTLCRYNTQRIRGAQSAPEDTAEDYPHIGSKAPHKSLFPIQSRRPGQYDMHSACRLCGGRRYHSETITGQVE